MIEPDPGAMRPGRAPVQKPAQWVWHGLRFVVVVETGPIVPTRVAAHLDQSRAKHDAEKNPAQKPNHDHRRLDMPATEKYGEEPNLEQDRFPAETIEGLADIDERKIKHPQECPYQH